MMKTLWDEITTPDFVAVCPFCEKRMELPVGQQVCIHAHNGIIFAHNDCANKAWEEAGGEPFAVSGEEGDG